MPKSPVTCEVRYHLDPERIAEFEAYARIWIKLIERHGGTHHGYFMPREIPQDTKVSFQGLGSEGATDVAIALFTFADEEAFRRAWPRPHGSATIHRFAATSAFF